MRIIQVLCVGLVWLQMGYALWSRSEERAAHPSRVR